MSAVGDARKRLERQTHPAPTIPDLLWSHLLYGGGDTGDDPECKCGATPPETWWEEDFGEIRWHHAHLAQVIAS